MGGRSKAKGWAKYEEKCAIDNDPRAPASQRIIYHVGCEQLEHEVCLREIIWEKMLARKSKRIASRSYGSLRSWSTAQGRDWTSMVLQSRRATLVSSDPDKAEDIGDVNDVEDDTFVAPKSRLCQADANVALLAKECGLAKVVHDARRALDSRLYLGLDISTRSTGYTVLRPGMEGSSRNWDDEKSLKEAGEASLVEWGRITTEEGKDILDFGDIIRQRLEEVGERCSGGMGGRVYAGAEEGGEIDNGDTGMWVVAVEDFMKTFGPGRFNTRSLFTLAQLNGIVKYTCLKEFGSKATAYHPTTARAFYGLLKDKPKNADIKQVVRDFVLSREGGSSLFRRYEWPTEKDGSLSSGSFDVTDAYLVASYSWHQDMLSAVVATTELRKRFVAAYRLEHAERIKRAEERALKRSVDAGAPAAGKEKTEAEVRRVHRSAELRRLHKMYNEALALWFKREVVGLSARG